VIVTRFAPAPTGFLHLGHVLNAIYVWGTAPSHAASSSGDAGDRRVLLRIEDHDRQRCRPEFERAIVEDLVWLGFIGRDAPFVRQSERGDHYASALATLRAAGLVYACDCTRAQIATADPGAEELRYPGTCAHKHLAEEPGRGIRVRLAASHERFVDLRHGPQEQRPSEQCGDLLVRDRHGNWTYQFVATVDDWLQGVSLVIRGDDLLQSTGRQIQLARLLGRSDPPQFLHHPLLMKTTTQKLSKADGDTSVRELRSAGWSPEDVLGEAAARGLRRSVRV
jgi:glutamyl-Q tRNA(Asp) synthetase